MVGDGGGGCILALWHQNMATKQKKISTVDLRRAAPLSGHAAASQAPSLLAAGASGLGRMAGAARDTLLAHPELFIEGADLVEGILDPGPPPPSKGGYIGGLASKIYDKFNQ